MSWLKITPEKIKTSKLQPDPWECSYKMFKSDYNLCKLNWNKTQQGQKRIKYIDSLCEAVEKIINEPPL